jgi:predicted alpha/beta-hydrolase family hydrolase
MRAVTTIEIDTPHGPAAAHLQPADAPVGALVLGHGAGGGVAAPDLVAAAGVALGLGISVALVEQPYRVAGRRSPAPAHHLDAAWIAVVEHLRASELGDIPIVTGGRSSGARVACRTAAQTGCAAVLCLAFPLQPPRRKNGSQAPSRQPELDAVTVPVLVVQGEGDPFGMPQDGPRRSVVRLRGNHSLRSDMPGLKAAVEDWLRGVVTA